MLPIFKQFQETCKESKTDYKADDKADDETDDEIDYESANDKTDNEQSDTTNIPDLETEESAEQRRKQKGEGLKILTPQQILSRIPISLAPLEAGNNSENLKNKIRQLLYLLYRSKKLSKTIYNTLVNAI